MTPRSARTNSIRSYERKKIGYPNNKKERKEKKETGKEKMECILAEENDSLEKSVPGIMQSRERRVGVHIVTFDELNGYIATNLCVYTLLCQTVV